MKKLTHFLTRSSLVLAVVVATLSFATKAQAQFTNFAECLANGYSDVECQDIMSRQGGITNPAIGQLGNDAAGASDGSLFVGYFITLWRALIVVGGLAVVYFFIWGALRWILAGGDAGKVQKARDQIIQAIIGMILLVSSFVIIGFVSQLVFGENFDILNLTLPQAGQSTTN